MLERVEVTSGASIDFEHDLLGMELHSGNLNRVSLVRRKPIEMGFLEQAARIGWLSHNDCETFFPRRERLYGPSELPIDESNQRKLRLRLQRSGLSLFPLVVRGLCFRRIGLGRETQRRGGARFSRSRHLQTSQEDQNSSDHKSRPRMHNEPSAVHSMTFCFGKKRTARYVMKSNRGGILG
jgi:hypothetical protein